MLRSKEVAKDERDAGPAKGELKPMMKALMQ
jgi:hypothetical protein